MVASGSEYRIELFFSLLLMRRQGDIGMVRLEAIGISVNLSLISMAVGFDLVKVFFIDDSNKRCVYLRSRTFVDEYAAGTILVSEVEPW